MEKSLVLVGVVMFLWSGVLLWHCCQGGAACAAVLGVGAVRLLCCKLGAPYPTCAELNAVLAGRCIVLLTVPLDLIWTGGIDWLHMGCLGVAGAPLPLQHPGISCGGVFMTQAPPSSCPCDVAL